MELAGRVKDEASTDVATVLIEDNQTCAKRYGIHIHLLHKDIYK